MSRDIARRVDALESRQPDKRLRQRAADLCRDP